MSSPLAILIVEENAAPRDAWTETLRGAGHRVFAFGSLRAALESAAATSFDMALVSFADPALCRELQALLKERNPACQVTLLTDRPTEEKDAMALEAGARQVLLRPLPAGRLESVVDRVAASRQRRRPAMAGGVDTLLGESAAMEKVRRMIRQVAAVPDTSVLVTGESGTGKELVARAVHIESRRAGEPFLEINCAAIPSQLLESELFGHEAGAFTDATRMKPGLFELAHRGTLFLDEIGELSLDLQAKLLRVLDTRTVRRVAGQESIPLDVRILAATNRVLREEVAGRRFREDLYHRLNVVHLHLPPLRERGGDLALLARHFVGLFARKFGQETAPPDDLLLQRMSGYAWPGNVRELANSLERAVLLSAGRPLMLEDFPFLDAEKSTGRVRLATAGVTVEFGEGPVSLEGVERELIRQALDFADWNVTEAARLLDMGRGALRYKMARHGVERKRRAG